MLSRVLIALSLITVLALVLFLPKTSLNFSTDSKSDDKKTLGEAIAKSAPVIKEADTYRVVRTNAYQDPPTLTAKSAIIIDTKTGTSLFEKDPNLKLLPASTTKLMTALVALESCTLDKQVQIQSVNNSGTQMGLQTGDMLTVESLLYGMLIPSGNDAAFALANNCAASYSQFIDRMNEKAKQLQMEDTHFVNPAGLDEDLEYSTAHDLAHLASVAVANPQIAKIVSTKSTVVTDITGKRTYFLQNVNKLLGVVDGVDGVKTGQTEGALEILISKTTRDGHSIITAVLSSHDRFGESKDLIEWAFKNYRWEN